ncbi:hypothetical protein GQ600_8919 [Phytophthora cactorum]|nr:hypothetical protein GQ600_8919 [Phytophthora cactorum]
MKKVKDDQDKHTAIAEAEDDADDQAAITETPTEGYIFRYWEEELANASSSSTRARRNAKRDFVVEGTQALRSHVPLQRALKSYFNITYTNIYFCVLIYRNRTPNLDELDAVRKSSACPTEALHEAPGSRQLLYLMRLPQRCRLSTEQQSQQPETDQVPKLQSKLRPGVRENFTPLDKERAQDAFTHQHAKQKLQRALALGKKA